MTLVQASGTATKLQSRVCNVRSGGPFPEQRPLAKKRQWQSWQQLPLLRNVYNRCRQPLASLEICTRSLDREISSDAGHQRTRPPPLCLWGMEISLGGGPRYISPSASSSSFRVWSCLFMRNNTTESYLQTAHAFSSGDASRSHSGVLHARKMISSSVIGDLRAVIARQVRDLRHVGDICPPQRVLGNWRDGTKHREMLPFVRIDRVVPGEPPIILRRTGRIGLFIPAAALNGIRDAARTVVSVTMLLPNRETFWSTHDRVVDRFDT